MLQLLLIGVFAALLINLLVAVIASARGARTESWLLVILLSGTTGAALIAVLAVLTGAAENRMLDAGLVLVGLAALTAAVRAAAGRRRHLKEG